MTENNATLVVENVTKKFGEFTAVDDLSFEVRPGRVWFRTLSQELQAEKPRR